MRRGLILLAFAVVLWPAASLAAAGGPDRDGYEWADSSESGAGVTYEWIDISTSGTELTGLGNDGQSALIPIGFDFVFYGTTYANLYIGADGYLSFITNTQEGLIRQCPGPDIDEPNGAIFGFYQDLDPSEDAGGGIFYETLDSGTGSARFVVSFESIDLFQGSPAFGSDPVTFQMVLYEGTNEIQVNVAESGALSGGPRWSYNTAIGIENDDATIGLSHCPGVIQDSYAVRFFRSTGYGLYPTNQTIFGAPGTTATGEIELVNFSSAEVTASVSAISTRRGWTGTPESTSVTAPADGGVAMVRLDVEIPSTTVGGVDDEFNVTVDVSGTELAADVEVVATFMDDDWQMIDDLPRALQDVQLVTDNTYLYVMGGSYLDTTTDLWTPVDKTYRWSPENNWWDDEAFADMPNTITAGSACFMDGKIYYVGGWDGAAADGTHWSFSPDLHIYDIATDTWSTGAAPPHAMAHANIACHDAANSVYVFNGYADLDDNGDYINRVDGGADWTEPHTFVYSADSDGWTERTPAPDGVSGSAVGLIGTRILLAGGFFDHDTDPTHSGWVTRSTRIYSLSSDSWSSGGWLSTYTSRTAGVVYESQLCAIGGRQSERIDTWECYADPMWVPQIDHLTLARESLGGALLDGHIYVVGGDGGDWVTDRAERWPTADLVPPSPPDDDGEPVAEDVPEPVADVSTDGEADPVEESDGGGGKGCGCSIVS